MEESHQTVYDQFSIYAVPSFAQSTRAMPRTRESPASDGFDLCRPFTTAAFGMTDVLVDAVL